MESSVLEFKLPEEFQSSQRAFKRILRDLLSIHGHLPRHIKDLIIVGPSETEASKRSTVGLVALLSALHRFRITVDRLTFRDVTVAVEKARIALSPSADDIIIKFERARIVAVHFQPRSLKDRLAQVISLPITGDLTLKLSLPDGITSFIGELEELLRKWNLPAALLDRMDSILRNMDLSELEEKGLRDVLFRYDFDHIAQLYSDLILAGAFVETALSEAYRLCDPEMPVDFGPRMDPDEAGRCWPVGIWNLIQVETGIQVPEELLPEKELCSVHDMDHFQQLFVARTLGF